MLTREQINQFELEVEEKYKQEKEAVRIMRRLLDVSESRPQQQPAVSLIDPTKVSAPKVLPPLDDGLSTPTLLTRIEQIVVEFGPKEQWTMRRMLAYLKQIGVELSAKPEGTISAALSKLAAQGKLIIERQGAGSVPSIYRLRTQEDAIAPKSELLFEEGKEKAL